MNYSFNFEIKNLLTQFVAAFDNVVIKRYDRDRNPKEDIAVRYVLAPKQRVMYDIVNKAQNLTLPVVAIEVKSISRDNNRVFNKLSGFDNFSRGNSKRSVKTPVPVNVSVSMSILARYMQDMDQIMSSFVQNTNPYIIITWSEPDSTGDESVKAEIRTEILWDGTVTMTTPTDSTFNDKFRIVGDTTFTIKGWIFRDSNIDSIPIYKITESFYSSPESIDLLDVGEYDLFKQTLSGAEDLVRITTAAPKITNLYFRNNNNLLGISSQPKVTPSTSNTYTLLGEFFIDTTSIMLSSNSTLTQSTTSITTRFETLSTNTLSGYTIPQNNIKIVDDNIIEFTIPELQESGIFDVIVYNELGWDTTARVLNTNLESVV